MNVTQEPDRVHGGGVLTAMACVVVISAIGVLTAYLIDDCRSAELAGAQGPSLYIGPSAGPRPGPAVRSIPAPAPGAPPVPGLVPGQLPEKVNQIEQVLFAERSPGLEERAYEHTLLRSYGWVNRDTRLVRIPIDRAIELYIKSQGQHAIHGPGQAPGQTPGQTPGQAPGQEQP